MTVAEDPALDALLGRFHPSMADRLERLLAHRGIAHRRIDRDDHTELVVDGSWCDDLRAELALTWPQLVAALPGDQQATVRGLGGATPGWFDAPRGGWVDRSGRFVVEREDAEPVRLTGPLVAAAGIVLVLGTWYLDGGATLLVLGLGATIVGALLPR